MCCLAHMGKNEILGPASINISMRISWNVVISVKAQPHILIPRTISNSGHMLGTFQPTWKQLEFSFLSCMIFCRNGSKSYFPTENYYPSACIPYHAISQLSYRKFFSAYIQQEVWQILCSESFSFAIFVIESISTFNYFLCWREI